MTSKDSDLRRDKNKAKAQLNLIMNTQSEGTRLLGLLGLGWIVTLLGILFASYVGRDFTEILSFKVDDEWCPSNIAIIGQHCFGDFGHPFNRGGLPHVYLKDNLVAVNSPLVMLMFEFIRLFDYRIGLWLFLLIGTASVMTPVWWATKTWPMMAKFITLFLVGFGSLGFISAFDRANPVIFFPGLILWFVVANENDRREQAILAIAIMSAMKFWGPLFMICLIMDRRWRDMIRCTIITSALVVLPLLYFPGRMITKMKITLNGITSEEYANIFQPYVISIGGLIRRVSCGLTTGTTCNTVTANWGIFGKSSFATAVAIGVSVWAAVQYFRNPKTTVMKYIPIIVLGAIALPTAQTYNTILFIPAACLILKWHSPFSTICDSMNPKILVPAVLSGITPIPIWYFGDSVLSSTNGTGPVFRIAYWLIPIMWVCLLFETIWRTRRRRLSPAVETPVS
jgi:hypothetical protein